MANQPIVTFGDIDYNKVKVIIGVFCVHDALIDLSENLPPHIVVATTADSHIIVVEQSLVMTSTDFSSAVADFIGVIYAMDLEYRGKHTYDFLQAVFLKLGRKKLAPKVLSLCEKTSLAEAAKW